MTFNCENITDVSALGNVEKLYLKKCSNITDVSSLGNVEIFYIYMTALILQMFLLWGM